MTAPISPPEAVAPGVWRLPFKSRTLPPFDHTNSYLIADRGVGVLVDFGGEEPTALDALEEALGTLGVKTLKALLLTHTHPDHCAGAAALQARFEVPVYVHPLEQPRLDLPGQVLALQDSRTLTVGDKTVRALHTPGHSPGHLSFHLPETRTVLAGDLIAAQGSTWVGLPEGDVAAYLASLDRLRALDASRIGPGHGPVIMDPAARLGEAKTHRLERERQVLRALGDRPLTLPELKGQVYPEVPPQLDRLTEGSLLAHLRKLMAETKVMHLGDDERGPYAARAGVTS